MNLATKIICKSVGALGIGVALYDSAKIAKQYSEIGMEHAQEHYLEKVYYDSRTIDKVSFSDNVIREKTFETRTKNPIPGMFGWIKGGVKGFLYGLGNYLPVAICSTLAIVCKTWAAKAGAIGVGLCALYKIARNGYSLGKDNPMH